MGSGLVPGLDKPAVKDLKIISNQKIPNMDWYNIKNILSIVIMLRYIEKCSISEIH